MKPAPQLIDHLVQLTAIRDAELLEYSLLRTLRELLASDMLELFRLGGNGAIGYLMRCTADEAPQLATGDVVLAAEIVEAARAAAQSAQPVRGVAADGRHFAVFPVLELRGAITCLHVVANRPTTPEEERLIHGFLKFYANYCGLLDYSQRDQLTGLLNRKTFDESVYKLFGQRERPQALLSEATPNPNERRHDPAHGQFWIGMIDIDHFKRINDGFGHLYGDEVLLLTAQIMRRSFRDGDLLFRFGGEEFVAIIQHVNRDLAKAVFERLRARIAAHSFPQIGQVTVSVGVAELQPGAMTPVLLDQADKALYYCKQNGRNRVAIFEELRDAGLIVEAPLSQRPVELF